MATTKNAPDSDLRNRLRGEPGVTPEDTRSELLQDGQAQTLRNKLRGEPGVSPEDTRSELLAATAKEDRKISDADAMRKDREDTARAWTAPQAQSRVARDIADHDGYLALGKRGDGDAFYLRSDMAEQANVNPVYDHMLKTTAPELHARVLQNDKENVTVDLTGSRPAPTSDAQPKSAAAQANEDQANPTEKGLQAELEDDLRRRKAREQEQAGQGLNTVDLQRSGKEIERPDLIMPRRITQAYTEIEGKFFAKDTNRVMFEDKGDKLATSTTNKDTVADMVAYAKAKQWDSLKLTGSQDFRREAWLQAESQGIKTQGYTPKQSDLAGLETLRQERATNSITPLAERKAQREAPSDSAAVPAPRHDINKNQPSMHVEASKFIASNIQALQKQPGMVDKSVEDLTKLAYWRGIVNEENKQQPKPVQDDALARFDKQAVDPQFLKRLDQETKPTIQDKTTDRVQKRDTHEQSL